MASLFKRPESSVWWAQFYIKDPQTEKLKKVRKSTGQKSKKLALPIAIEMERMAQGVMESGSDKAQRAKAILAEAVAGIDRETFNASTARKVLAEFLAVATGEDMPTFTVQSWLGEWIERKRRGSSPATISRYEGSVRSFIGWLGPDRSAKPLESITMADVRKWRETLQDAGRAGKTVNGYVKDIGAGYRAAIREGLVTFNPCAALDPLDTSDSITRKPFTLDEVAALLAAAPDDEWRGLILVGAFTGLRLADAAKIKWSSIDLESHTITVMPAKTRKKKRVVTIPIQPDLHSFLTAAKKSQDHDADFVFSALSKKNPEGRSGLSETFTRLMATAGVSRGKATREGQEKSKGRVAYERGFHSLRHTFTTWLRGAGVSEEDRMSLTGHSTRDSHAVYSHADEKKLRDAISRLPLLGGG